MISCQFYVLKYICLLNILWRFHFSSHNNSGFIMDSNDYWTLIIQIYFSYQFIRSSGMIHRFLFGYIDWNKDTSIRKQLPLAKKSLRDMSRWVNAPFGTTFGWGVIKKFESSIRILRNPGVSKKIPLQNFGQNFGQILSRQKSFRNRVSK